MSAYFELVRVSSYDGLDLIIAEAEFQVSPGAVRRCLLRQGMGSPGIKSDPRYDVAVYGNFGDIGE